MPGLDERLQKRYLRLVGSHRNVVQAVAAGIKALPDGGGAFAATQAAWRFFQNPRVTLPALVEPLRDVGRKGAEKSESAFVLVVFDWSKMDYASHGSKRDLTQISHAADWGYELATALLVDAASGAPLANDPREGGPAVGCRGPKWCWKGAPGEPAPVERIAASPESRSACVW